MHHFPSGKCRGNKMVENKKQMIKDTVLEQNCIFIFHLKKKKKDKNDIPLKAASNTPHPTLLEHRHVHTEQDHMNCANKAKQISLKIDTIFV